MAENVVPESNPSLLPLNSIFVAGRFRRSERDRLYLLLIRRGPFTR